MQNREKLANWKLRELSHRSELVHKVTSCRWKCKKHFVHEHPKNSTSWEMPEVQSLVNDPRVCGIDGPMCRWSLKARGSKAEFMRKQMMAHEFQEIAEVLRRDGRWKLYRRHIHMTGKSETVSESCITCGGNVECYQTSVGHFGSIHCVQTSSCLRGRRASRVRFLLLSFASCVSRIVTVRRVWTALDVPSGWIQVLRGPRPLSQQWPSSKRRATSVVESPAQRQQRTATTNSSKSRPEPSGCASSRGPCASIARRGRRCSAAEGSEIGGSSSHIGRRRHSRSEVPPRCSEEGQSGSPRHPSGGAVGRVPEVCCKMRGPGNWNVWRKENHWSVSD